MSSSPLRFIPLTKPGPYTEWMMSVCKNERRHRLYAIIRQPCPCIAKVEGQIWYNAQDGKLYVYTTER